MSRKGRVICTITAGIVLLTGYIWRVTVLNQSYPDPQIRAAGEGEALQLGNYVWRLEEADWRDGAYLKDKFPNYIVAYGEDGREYSTEKECVLLIRVNISKTQDDDTWLDLTETAFESGPWHNQFDPELFELLNPDVPLIGFMLQAGSSVMLTFPVILLKDTFTENQWGDVKSGKMKIDTVLACYPVKYVLGGYL